jgi:imidazole glycerol-phosphate synthase subunit HisF
MKCHRIIARLDIKGPNLVKGVHFEGLRVLGKPEVFAKIYYQQGIDELFFQDTVASLYQRENIWSIVKNTAEEVFIPLTVGGGLRTLGDIRNALTAGADKVAINTAAINRPELIDEVANTFGSSTIVISIEAIRGENGEYFAYIENGRESTGVEVVSWAEEVEKRGAGELVISSIDREGTGKGYDLDLLSAVTDRVSIPVIAHGGAGDNNQIAEAIRTGGVDAVAIASMLHYGTLKQYKERSFHEDEGNADFLNLQVDYARFGSANVMSIKESLKDNGVPVRLDG